MANEKKKQTSTSKKKTTQEKAKQTKIEMKKKVEENGKTKDNVKAKSSTKKATKSKSTNTKKEEMKKNTNKVIEKQNTQKEETKTKEIVAPSLSDKQSSKLQKKNRKEINKGSRKNEKVTPDSVINTDEMGKLVKIILVLVVITVLFYGLTVIITKFQKTSVPERNKNTTPAVIQYDEILIGTMLNQLRDEYYVLIQKDDDKYQTLTSYYLGRYSGVSNSLKVYTANMNSVFNQFYISETPNVKPNDISEFRVSTVTLVKIKNHAIVEAYSGLEEVENAFKNMINKK